MSESEDRSPVVVDRDHRAEVGAFLLGALVGAGIALLLAPRSGKETQEAIRERAGRLRELTGDRVRDLRSDLGSRMESAKGALGRGRERVAEARADLEERLARSKAAYRTELEDESTTGAGES